MSIKMLDISLYFRKMYVFWCKVKKIKRQKCCIIILYRESLIKKNGSV